MVRKKFFVHNRGRGKGAEMVQSTHGIFIISANLTTFARIHLFGQSLPPFLLTQLTPDLHDLRLWAARYRGRRGGSSAMVMAIVVVIVMPVPVALVVLFVNAGEYCVSGALLLVVILFQPAIVHAIFAEIVVGVGLVSTEELAV